MKMSVHLILVLVLVNEFVFSCHLALVRKNAVDDGNDKNILSTKNNRVHKGADGEMEFFTIYIPFIPYSPD